MTVPATGMQLLQPTFSFASSRSRSREFRLRVSSPVCHDGCEEVEEGFAPPAAPAFDPPSCLSTVCRRELRSFSRSWRLLVSTRLSARIIYSPRAIPLIMNRLGRAAILLFSTTRCHQSPVRRSMLTGKWLQR